MDINIGINAINNPIIGINIINTGIDPTTNQNFIVNDGFIIKFSH